MTAVVTDLSFARRHLTDSNVSVAAIYSGWRAGDLTNLYQELLKVRNAHEAAGQQTLSDRQVMADSCRYPVGKHLFPDGLRRSS